LKGEASEELAVRQECRPKDEEAKAGCLSKGSTLLVRKVSIDEWFKATVVAAHGDMLKVQFFEGSIPVFKTVDRHSDDIRAPSGLPPDVPSSPRRCFGRLPPLTVEEDSSSMPDVEDVTMETQPDDDMARPIVSSTWVVESEGSATRLSSEVSETTEQEVNKVPRCGMSMRLKSVSAGKVVKADVIDSSLVSMKVAYLDHGRCKMKVIPFSAPDALGLAGTGHYSTVGLEVGAAVWVRSASSAEWCKGTVTALLGESVKVVFWKDDRPCVKVVPTSSADLWVEASEEDVRLAAISRPLSNL